MVAGEGPGLTGSHRPSCLGRPSLPHQILAPGPKEHRNSMLNPGLIERRLYTPASAPKYS